MKHKSMLYIAIITLLSSCTLLHAQVLEVGSKTPPFRIMSGAGNVITHEDIKNKVTIIFYESKEVIEDNRQLKNVLNEFYQQQTKGIKSQITRLPVIDCTSAFWPFKSIWKNNLKKHSEKEGITIYGDWDGNMFTDFSMNKNESNIVIIDKEGIIRYIFSGKADDGEINAIKNLLSEL